MLRIHGVGASSSQYAKDVVSHEIPNIMRIGILTFHNAINYGAVLQTYASQLFLSSLGHEVEVIDYHNPYIENVYKRRLEISLSPKASVVSLLMCIFNCRRKGKFKRFVACHLQLSKQVFSKEDEMLDRYDLILVGSDQVWNPKQTGGFDEFFWGQFRHKGVLASWAASFKEGAFEDGDLSKVREYVRAFDGISVREEVLKTYLAPLTDRPVEVLPDPTLLINRHEWRGLCHGIEGRGYVLVYAMKDERLVVEKGRQLAERHGLLLLIINPYVNAKVSVNYKQCLGPEDFLSYIHGARYVVTSSFHGTAFSLIFEKEFYCVIRRGSTNVRIQSLLELMGLENRIIAEDHIFTEDTSIDYKTVSAKREVMKGLCADFINHMHTLVKQK